MIFDPGLGRSVSSDPRQVVEDMLQFALDNTESGIADLDQQIARLEASLSSSRLLRTEALVQREVLRDELEKHKRHG